MVIEHSWSTDFRVGLIGCTTARHIEVCCGDGAPPVAVTFTGPRPDIGPLGRGFAVEIERRATHRLTAKVDGEIVELTIEGQPPIGDPTAIPPTPLWDRFTDEVNERRLPILEIGARIVPPSNLVNRGRFAEGLYTGFDYHPGDNVDVVGDAHRLTQYFPPALKFGAICSLSVMEHLAMPWVAAVEMIRLLEVGGLMFHHVPAAWPPHEQPSDFWRMSIDGLKVLFPEALGMTIEGVATMEPVHMYFDRPTPGQELFPLAPAYAFSTILARKTRAVDDGALRWFDSHEALLGTDNQYPRPTG